MKKSIIVLSVIILTLSSCVTGKKVTSTEPLISEKDSVKVSVDVTYTVAGENNVRDTTHDSDTTLWSEYLFLNIEKGYKQSISFPSNYNVWNIIDPTKMKIIDTLQYQVHFKDL